MLRLRAVAVVARARCDPAASSDTEGFPPSLCRGRQRSQRSQQKLPELHFFEFDQEQRQQLKLEQILQQLLQQVELLQ